MRIQAIVFYVQFSPHISTASSSDLILFNQASEQYRRAKHAKKNRVGD